MFLKDMLFSVRVRNRPPRSPMKTNHSLRAVLATALLFTGFSLSTTFAAAALADPAPAAAPDATHTASASSANYLLHTTDLLHVEIAGDPNSSRDVRLDSDGTVSLPYLDDPVKLSGLTVNQAIKAIAALYVDRQIFVKPQVSLVIVQYAEQHINVVGQVNHPGPVTIPPGQTMTLVSTISAAGGPTRIADNIITINRKLPDGKIQTIHVSLKQAMEDPNHDIALEDGDSIYVDEDLIS